MPKIKDDAKKHRIMNAAIKVISERVFFKSTISNIAKIADVADGTIYTYFQNKEDLLIQCFDYVLDNILSDIIDNIKKENDCFKKIKVIITGHMEFMEKNPDLANFLQIQLRQSKKEIRLRIKNIMRRYYKIIGEILKKAISEGVVRDDVNFRIIGHMIFGTVDEIVTSWVLTENRCSLIDKSEDVYKLIISAIKR